MGVGRLGTWRGMMRQTLTVAAPSTRSVYGELTYGTPVSYKCRLVGKRRLVLNGQGQEVTSFWTAYLFSNDVISPESLVTLSTGDVNSTEAPVMQPPIKSVKTVPDEFGRHHTVLYL